MALDLRSAWLRKVCLKRSTSGDMAGILDGRRQAQAIEQADVVQMNEPGADVADMDPGLAFVVTAPVEAVVAQPRRIGGAERHRFQTEAMKAVHQADIAGE